MSVPVWGRLSGGRPMARCAIRPAAWGASMLRIRRACGAPMPAGIRRASPWALMMPAVTPDSAPTGRLCAFMLRIFGIAVLTTQDGDSILWTGILTGGSNKYGSVHQLWICQHIFYIHVVRAFGLSRKACARWGNAFDACMILRAAGGARPYARKRIGRGAGVSSV